MRTIINEGTAKVTLEEPEAAQDIKEYVSEALRSLGVHGTVRIKPVDERYPDRLEVHINDRYIGVWDVARATFVD